jgi:Pvc16 N-terminal domain/IPT/TIG domain
MSNFLAIATVTETLRRILDREVGQEVPGATITVQPPDTIAAPPAAGGLNIFLFHVSRNSAFNNFDLPTRNSNFEQIQRPLLGVDLHYLLTAYSDGVNDVRAHIILASAMRALHENPIIDRTMIIDTISGPGSRPELATSDLNEQIEQVKITPQIFSLEEISKLSSSFFENRYRLSVGYLATVVILHSQVNTRPTLPVKRPAIYVIPFKQPLIEKIEPQIVEWSVNPTITIRGKNLKPDEQSAVVRFGQTTVVVPPQDVTDDNISVTIPNGMTAGIRSVQVVHELRFGARQDPYRIFESNIMAFVFVPKIINILTPFVAQGSELRIQIQPLVMPGQRIEFLLGNTAIQLDPIPVGSPPQNELSIVVPGNILPPLVNQDSILLRVRIDGAESLLQSDADGRFVSPAVIITR